MLLEAQKWPHVTEDKRNKVSIKVYEDMRDALENARKHLPKKEQPDYADMIEPAVNAWLKLPDAIGKLASVIRKRGDQQWHDWLDEVLADQEERVGIEKNLKWAIDSIRNNKSGKKKPPRPGEVANSR